MKMERAAQLSMKYVLFSPLLCLGLKTGAVNVQILGLREFRCEKLSSCMVIQSAKLSSNATLLNTEMLTGSPACSGKKHAAEI